MHIWGTYVHMYTKYKVSVSNPVTLGMMPTHSHTQRWYGVEPSEPFIYWGLKSYRSTFNDISLCKKKHSPWKKSTKSTPAHQKMQATGKKAQKSIMVLLKALAMIPASLTAVL